MRRSAAASPLTHPLQFAACVVNHLQLHLCMHRHHAVPRQRPLSLRFCEYEGRRRSCGHPDSIPSHTADVKIVHHAVLVSVREVARQRGDPFLTHHSQLSMELFSYSKMVSRDACRGRHSTDLSSTAHQITINVIGCVHGPMGYPFLTEKGEADVGMACDPNEQGLGWVGVMSVGWSGGGGGGLTQPRPT